MVLLKKSLNSWFDEFFFFSEREFLQFQHCESEKLWKFNLIHLTFFILQKFRESNVFTLELIWRNISWFHGSHSFWLIVPSHSDKNYREASRTTLYYLYYFLFSFLISVSRKNYWGLHLQQITTLYERWRWQPANQHWHDVQLGHQGRRVEWWQK